MNVLRWLWGTSEGGYVRIAVGVAIFAALALVDIKRRGKQATRWREYLFLLACVAMAMATAIINDMVTVTLSPVYFIVHENLARYDQPNIRWIALSVAMRGSWWVGLMGGVAILFANNPSKTWPQLPMRKLYKRIGMVMLLALACSALLGLLAYMRVIGGMPADVDIRERLFTTVLWAHTGAYIGGGLGIIGALASVIHLRRRSAKPLAASHPA
jgi:hypothetical protein